MEELQLIVGILSKLTDGALIGVITYMVLDFLKIPLVVLIVGIFITKLEKYNNE